MDAAVYIAFALGALLVAAVLVRRADRQAHRPRIVLVGADPLDRAVADARERQAKRLNDTRKGRS